MNMNELIEMAGGLKEDLGKIIAGGPMMGPAMFSTDCPFIKTSSALLCLTKKDAELPPESNCIRCAKCINACPMGLMPAKLNKLALAKDYEGFAANKVLIVLNVVLALMYVQLSVTLLRLSEFVSVKQWLL